MGKFNSKQFLFIILGTCIVSFKTYPNIVINYGKRDAWIATLIASILVFIFYIYILKICLKTNSYNVHKIYTYALGDTLGNIFYVFFIFTMFLTLIESSAIEANSMHQNMLLETPPWYILLFFVISAGYAVSKGLRPLILITIVGIVFVMLAGINLGVLTAKYKENKYLYPILQYGFNKDMIIATIKSLGMYSAVGITFPYLNEVFDKKNIIRGSIVGLLIVLQMEIYSIIGVITTFGYKRAVTIYYPKLLQTQLVKHFDFLESGELFVMLQIVGGWFIKYCITFYALLKLLEAFNIKSKKSSIGIISVSVFVISYFAEKNSFKFLNFLIYYNYISLINFIIIPGIIFTVYYIKKADNKSRKNTDTKENSNQNNNMSLIIPKQK